jgi:hypothetical protein
MKNLDVRSRLMILIIYSNERYDKIKILKSISDAGGVIESLDQLEQIPRYGKPLLRFFVISDTNTQDRFKT